METCETCKWWIKPPPEPLGWGGPPLTHGVCRHFANDRFDHAISRGADVRIASRFPAEHSCREHQPKGAADE